MPTEFIDLSKDIILLIADLLLEPEYAESPNLPKKTKNSLFYNVILGRSHAETYTMRGAMKVIATTRKK